MPASPGTDRAGRPAAEPTRLGVFGGTFDPIHFAHLRLAEEAAEALGLDRVIFVPAGTPPLRAQPVAGREHRLRMVRLATAGNPFFAVSDFERRRPGVSYTYETLEHLKQLHPASELFLLMGADQLLQFHRWRHPERILHEARLLAFDRPGSVLNLAELPRIHGRRFPRRRVVRIRVSQLDISATRIRKLSGSGLSVRYLVPESVNRYIRERKLYQAKALP